MEHTRKYVRIAIVILIVGVIICIVRTLTYQHEEKLFEEVYDCYSSGEFYDALSLAKKLPKPYNRYYCAYINCRVDLDRWEGTGPELLDWLKNALETIDAKNEDYNALDKLYICSNCTEIQQDFLDNYDWLKSAFVWHPQAEKVIDGFWEGFDDIFSRSYDLFAIEPEYEIVTIPCQEIRALDEEMDQLYSDSINSLNEIIVEYNIGDNSFYDIKWRKDDITSGYTSYSEYFSLSCIYDIDGKENLYISAQAANNNYNKKETILRFSKLTWGGRNSDPTDVLLEYVSRLFPDSSLTINVHEDA